LILSLEVEPRLVGAKKLKETPYYRIRSGDLRILYSIDDKNKLVRILSVGDRKDVYRPF
jgi:mRNA interferase RelE/StbE